MKKTLVLAAFLILTGVLVVGLNANDEDPLASGSVATEPTAEQDRFGPGRRGAGIHRPDAAAIADEVGLSEEQVETLESMRSEHQKAMIKIAADAQVLRLELQELMQGYGNDEAVMTKHAELQAVMNRIKEMRISQRLEMRSIFTAEQWDTAKDLRRSGLDRERGDSKRGKGYRRSGRHHRFGYLDSSHMNRGQRFGRGVGYGFGR